MFIAISIVTREHNFQGSVFSDTLGSVWRMRANIYAVDLNY